MSSGLVVVGVVIDVDGARVRGREVAVRIGSMGRPKYGFAWMALDVEADPGVGPGPDAERGL